MNVHPEELENSITHAWRDIFNNPRIGPDDNFFELGGNSLLGMDLSELLSERLTLQVPVLTLYQHPTIRELTHIILTGELQ